MRELFPKEKAIVQSDLVKPVRLILFRVSGRAVPWSVPNIRVSRGKLDAEYNWIPGKNHTKKNRPLASWQKLVNLEARMAWQFQPPYEGPVGLSTWFYMRPPAFRSCTPDLTNVLKGMEDALQDLPKRGQVGVICNDNDVFAHHNERIMVGPDDEERAYCEVWAMPARDHDPDHKGPYSYRPWEWSTE